MLLGLEAADDKLQGLSDPLLVLVEIVAITEPFQQSNST